MMTLAELETIIRDAYRLDDEIEAYKRDVLKPRQAELDRLEGVIMQALADAKLKSFKSGAGLVTLVTRYSVQTPKTIDEKRSFFDWLKDKGDEIYWTYMTVNSQSLNALYKTELELAKEAGDFDFRLPGIGEPKASQALSRRKG